VLKVRNATVADARSIANIKIKSYKKGYENLLNPGLLDHMSLDEKEEEYTEIIQEVKYNGGCFFVAETDSGEIIGYAFAGNTTEKPPKKYRRKLGKLEEIFVLPDHWGKKIGVALFQKVVQFLLDGGYASLTLWTLEGADVENWYQKLNGEYLEAKSVEIEGFEIDGVVIEGQEKNERRYGWPQLGELAQLLDQILVNNP
jgi:GNAT superfamily N-acetyltransferase